MPVNNGASPAPPGGHKTQGPVLLPVADDRVPLPVLAPPPLWPPLEPPVAEPPVDPGAVEAGPPVALLPVAPAALVVAEAVLDGVAPALPAGKT